MGKKRSSPAPPSIKVEETASYSRLHLKRKCKSEGEAKSQKVTTQATPGKQIVKTAATPSPIRRPQSQQKSAVKATPAKQSAKTTVTARPSPIRRPQSQQKSAVKATPAKQSAKTTVTALPISQPPSQPSVPMDVENWNWLYTGSGVSWKLSQDLENLKTVFTFKLLQFTGKAFRVFAQTLTTRETFRSIQFKFCVLSRKYNRNNVVTPMAAITVEHYKASSRAMFQFHLMDAELAEVCGLRLDVLKAICRIAFKIEDQKLERRDLDDDMFVVEDVLYGVVMGVEEKEREAAARLERQKKFSRDVEGKAWGGEKKQSGSLDGNQRSITGAGGVKQASNLKGKEILLPDRCALL